MGASLSNLGSNGSTIAPSLGDIPENCVARVFLHLSPPEICNLARLNRAFRGAASADSVWESKLPSNYQHLLPLMPEELRCRNLSKKDIFAVLSKPLPFDDGNKVRVLLFCFVYCFKSFICGGLLMESAFFSNCGWIGLPVEFACQFRRKVCLLLELMIGDTGLWFLLKNLGYILIIFLLS